MPLIGPNSAERQRLTEQRGRVGQVRMDLVGRDPAVRRAIDEAMWGLSRMIARPATPGLIELLTRCAVLGVGLAGLAVAPLSHYSSEDEGGIDACALALLLRSHCYFGLGFTAALFPQPSELTAFQSEKIGSLEVLEDALGARRPISHRFFHYAMVTGLGIAFAEPAIFSGDTDELLAMLANFDGPGRAHHHRYDYSGTPATLLPTPGGLVLGYRCVRAGCQMLSSWPLIEPHRHHIDASGHVVVTHQDMPWRLCEEPGCPLLLANSTTQAGSRG